MTAEMNLSEEELRDLDEKVCRLWETLSDPQRRVLVLTVLRAAESSADVQGYADLCYYPEPPGIGGASSSPSGIMGAMTAGASGGSGGQPAPSMISSGIPIPSDIFSAFGSIFQGMSGHH